MSANQEERLKFLKELLSQILDQSIQSEIELEGIRSRKYKIERGLLLLKVNKMALKKEALIVNAAAYKIISEDLKSLENKFKELSTEFEKKKTQIDSLYNKENYILDEIDSLEKAIDSQRKVIFFDFAKKRRING